MVIITDLREKIKGIIDNLRPHEGALWALAMVIVCSLLGLGLWRLASSGDSLEPITIEHGVDFAERYRQEQGRGVEGYKQSPKSALSLSKGSPVREAETNLVTNISGAGDRLVASKNGTRYYYEHCAGVKRIKEANKIYFDTEAEAIARGLTLAANCQ